LAAVKEYFAKQDIPSSAIPLQMPRGTRIRTGELAGRLATLDVDEGIRIEGAGKKMFVNRSASGIFVVQLGNDFQHFESARQVLAAIKSSFGRYAAWAY
jgi:hypothetical protein